MSTALQTATHRPATLASPSIPSSAHQYSPTHSSSPSREAYSINQGTTASSSPRRPPSRKTSGNSTSPSKDASAKSSRGGTVAMPSATDNRPSTSASASDRIPNMPPVAPPRTSSSKNHASSSRRSYGPHDAMAASQSHATAQSSRSGSRSDAPISHSQSQSHRAKRAVHPPHLTQDGTARPSSSRSSRVSDIVIPARTHQTSTSRASHETNESPFRGTYNHDELNGRDARGSQRHSVPGEAEPPPIVAMSGAPEERRGTRSRHDHSRNHKGTSKFGDFILGNTIGEGEFGKVKLGWKQDSNVQVAIKLIKRDTVGSNPSRLGKIRREVTILREVEHPSIVRLIDMLETERYIGIILEYASGGELFDYILNNRYLRDPSARRLFAQLVSGVGYLHKKGIVHRDLKLENLLLDRHRNIIITDFGFANTFDADEELTDEEELNLTDRDFVKRLGLDKVNARGMRKGDLMQTSCGSPCYAAPELVVSDSLYTGRKVDVWSCGVILYAMLAGYLPFDDDPANPEGDNINLLYKYIVSTPLTFPEYVTPHARDLLRRILVPNPRKRADLFEVARHSWLSEYSQLVEFITSSTTSPAEVQNASSTQQSAGDSPSIARSSSVREAKHKAPATPTVGGLGKAHANIDQPEHAHRSNKDAKRRTVQVEYVAPTTQTQRGSDPDSSRSQTTSRGYDETQQAPDIEEKPLPQEPPTHVESYRRPVPSRVPPVSSQGPARSARDSRTTSDNSHKHSLTGGRPQTGGSMQSTASMALQSRGSYGQPAPPTIADTNAQGRIQQPNNAEDEASAAGRTGINVPPKYARMSGFNESRPADVKGHKRSSTIGDIGSRFLGRSGSIFGSKSKKRTEQETEKSRKYPPVSMSHCVAQGDEQPPRQSVDSSGRPSRRSVSLGVGKKPSGSMSGSQASAEKKERRRFSLLPASMSLKAVSTSKEYHDMQSPHVLPADSLHPPRHSMGPGDARGSSPLFDRSHETPLYNLPETATPPSADNARPAAAPAEGGRPSAVPQHLQANSHGQSTSDSSMDMRKANLDPQSASYGLGFAGSEDDDGRKHGDDGHDRGAVLQKAHKRFTDAYEQAEYRGHEGSSGAAKRVMDFFRRRGRARGGDDR